MTITIEVKDVGGAVAVHAHVDGTGTQYEKVHVLKILELIRGLGRSVNGSVVEDKTIIVERRRSV